MIETDHENLIWMSKSEVPKIIRWRIYLQSYDFLLRHIKGKENTVAYALSRLLLFETVWESDYDTDEANNALNHLLSHREEAIECVDYYAIFVGKDSIRVERNDVEPIIPLSMTEKEIFDSV